MDNRTVPSLSLDGWINDPLLKLDRLYGYFLSAEEDQSVTYKGNISSLKYIIGENNHDPEEVATVIKDILGAFLLRYYNTVEVNVSVDANANINDVDLGIDVAVVDSDGVPVKLSRLLNMSNSKLISLEPLIDELNSVKQNDYDYTWSSDVEMLATVGMTENQRGIISNTQEVFVYTVDGWKFVQYAYA